MRYLFEKSLGRSLTILGATVFLAACSTLPPKDPVLMESALRIKADMTFLADDALAGREAGTQGYDAAAAYVAEQYAAIGLAPAAADGTYFQPVKLRSFERNPDKMALTLEGPDGTTSLDYLTDFLPSNSSKYEEKTITGDLVFVGYGLDAPEYGYTNYKNIDVADKIVVVLGGMPKNIPSDVSAHLRRSRMDVAGAKGAAGVLTVYSPGYEEWLPWQRAGRYAQSAGVGWIDDQGNVEGEEGGVAASAIISPTSSATLFAGAEMSYADLVEAIIVDENYQPSSFELPMRAELSIGSTFEDVVSSNVVAKLEGTDLNAEYIVLTAHLDHIGHTKNIDSTKDSINNGALDNATGVSTMLEAARTFVASGERPRRSIIFAAVTAEEKGLVGSDYLAQHPLPGGEMVANVNLDMPLITYPFTDVIAFGAEHSTLEAPTRRATESMGVTLSDDPVPEMNLFVRSDHYSFVKQGIPSVFLFLGFENGGEDVFRTFMRTNYHGVKDDLGQAIDYYQGARFSKIKYLIANEIANSDEKPAWNDDSVFGKMFGK